MDKQIEILIEELRYEGILTTDVANRVIKKLTEATETPGDRLVESYKFKTGDKVHYFDKEKGALYNATFCQSEGNLGMVVPTGAKGIEFIDLDNIYPGYYR